jgi:hypothetical protein
VEANLERARHFLDRRTTAAFLATVARDGLPEVTPIVAAKLLSDGTLAAGEEDAVGGATFRNLRIHPRATLLLLDPVADPRSRDGVRLVLEFLGAEEDGPELAHMTEWLAAFAPGRRVCRRLLFRVVSIALYRAEPVATGLPAPTTP